MYTLIDGVQFYDKDEVDDLLAQNGSAGLSDRLDQEAIDRAAADDALGARIDQEVIDRAAADDALGTRIDQDAQELSDKLTQESNMRLLGDQTLSNQLTAIEQLWSTLVSANFIDTDSSAIVSDDSGKSIRQIAHDEFYRQFVTDADDVKQQLDTLKELADYLQNNPTILADIYTKLGLTWSLDTPTDFGTFDFSSVLTATDVDSAIVELHNTLVSKVGDLTQLTTTFKDSIVDAVNELDAEVGDLSTLSTVEKGTIVDAINSEFEWRRKNDETLGTRIDGEVTARTQADSALGTRIDNEVTAREQADTALGTRIDTEVGTLSALTTTAKDNVVAAINEVNGKVGTGGGGDAGAGVAQLETKLNEEITNRTNADTALGTRIDSEVTARTDADTALGTRIDTEIGTLSVLTTTAKDNVVAAINEVNGKVGTGGGSSKACRYTYVVDSNAALTAWANNDKASGQDYTSVLIRNGEWTSNTGVNLTTSGTKVVVGEPGSKLVFNGVEKGLYYTTAPTGPDYYMRDVTVTAGTGSGNGFGFHSCTNLTNCTGTGTGSGNGDGDGYGGGFHSCTNLTNCTGTGTGSRYGYGFRSCTNLTNCTGSGSGTGSGVGFGFNSCTNLTNCTGTGTGSGTGSGTGFGFHSCKTVIGCKAGKHCSTIVFQDCYASSSKTSTYACADTANGGFNNTTNPAA